MKNLKQLKELLTHKDNNPLEVIQIPCQYASDKEKTSFTDFAMYVKSFYCCYNTGWGGHKEHTTLESNEKDIIDVIGITEAILLKIKYADLKSFKAGFEREMHWINQMSIRISRFDYIAKVIYDKVDEIVNGLGKLDSYVKNNFDAITKTLPIRPEQIKLEKLSKIEILELIAKGELTPKRAEQFINKIDKDDLERNSDKLCPFSGSAHMPHGGGMVGNPDKAIRICSRTGDPKKLGDCGSCRVAAEWEEVYG